MRDDLDLPDDCWIDPEGDLRPGDVCAAVPFASLVAAPSAELYRHDDVPERYTIPVRLAYGLVVSVCESYVILAPITPAEVFDDADHFDRLADAARTSRVMLRLPRRAGDGWWEGAVAHLFMVETLLDTSVAHKRIGAMTDAARDIVARRVARAFGTGE